MARQAAQTQRRSGGWSIAMTAQIIRRALSERELMLTVVGVVLLSTFVFASIPKLFNSMSDEGIAHAVRVTSSFERNIGMFRAQRIAPGSPDLFAPVVTEGEQFQEGLADSIQSIISHREFVIDVVQHRVAPMDGTPAAPFPRYITMRHQSGVNDHIQIVSGRAPQPTRETIRTERSVLGRPEPQIAPVYEIMISTETARQLAVSLGDRLLVAPQETDTIARTVPRSSHRFLVVEIVGLFEVIDPAEEYWFGNPEIHRAVEYDDGNTVHIYATALFAPEDYPRLYADLPFPFRHGWRYFVNPDALDAGTLGQLSSDVRRLDAEYGFSTFARPEQTTVRTGLSNIFRRFESQRNLTESILSMTSIGLLGVACAVIGLVGALSAERHRESISLMRARGGSTRQMLLGQIVEGAMLAIPAVAAGFLVAVLVTEGRLTALSFLAAGFVGLATIALIALAASPAARGDLGASQRVETVERRSSARRVVLDASIIVIAIAAVVLIRRRGLIASSSAERLNEFDPYLAATPVLLGIAAGVLVLRFYPLPIRLIAALTGLRRDLVPALGFRRLARRRSASNLPLLVLLLAVAVAVFSSILLHTIAVGQVESSWQRVGADYRVQPPGSNFLFRDIDMSEVPEIEAIAEAHYSDDVVVTGRAGSFSTVQLFATDFEALERVNEGRFIDREFPDALKDDANDPSLGQLANPIPAIVSRNLIGVPMQEGSRFNLRLLGREVAFVAVEVVDRFPGLSNDKSFVVASRAQIQAANPTRALRTAWLLMRAPADAHDAIEETLASQSTSASLLSRAKEYGVVHDAPMVAGVQDGYRIGLIVTGVYAALAVMIAVTLSAHERSRDYSLLRTLGLSKEQTAGLTVIEFAPPFVISILAGVTLGIVVARVIAPSIDLTAFTGEGVPVELRVSWFTVALLLAGLFAVIGAAIAVATSISGRASLGRVLRVGDTW